MFVNTQYFREEGLKFLKYGYYCQDPIGSNAWKDYWGEQLKRCLNGYTVGGVTVTGDHYFYMNFCRIKLTESDGTASKVRTGRKTYSFPDFWDGDYNYFHVVDIARNGTDINKLKSLKLDVNIHQDHLTGGRHVIVGKARRKGYSYKNGAIVVNRYNTIRRSLCLIGAFEKKYLYPKGTMQMVTDYMNFLNEHTAFAKRRSVVDKQDHRRASFITMDEGGRKLEKGYMSEVIAVTYKDNPDASRGKDADLVLFEEAGKFDNLKASYLATKPVVEDGDITTGQMIIFGTGGDMDGGTIDFESMFYNPEPYNLLPLENVWDEGGYGTYCGFFVPSYMNKPGFMDKQGNSLKERAIASEDAKRDSIRRTSKDPGTFDRHITEYPFCIAEGELISSPEQGIKRIEDCNNVYYNGIKPIFELITERGRVLKMTEDHWVYSNGIWKEAKDLLPGDELSIEPVIFSKTNPVLKIDSGIPCVNSSINIDNDFAYLIGLYMADGSFYNKNKLTELSFVFDVKDIDVVEHVEKLLPKYFGTPTKRFTGKSKNCIELKVCDKNLSKIMNSLDLVYRNSAESLKRNVHIPEWLFSCNKEIIRNFIKGVYEGDGFFNSHQRSIVLFSKNVQFLRDIQLLLTGFGINGRIKSKMTKNGFGYEYMENNLRLTSFDASIFYKEIGVVSKRKSDIGIKVNSKPLRSFHDSADKFVKLIPVGESKVYDITTATHYYSCRGIKVHNCPKEAFLQTGSNIFPLSMIVSHKNHVSRTNINLYMGVNGNMTVVNNKVKFEPDPKARPVDKFPHDNKADNTGCVTIYQSPYREDGLVPGNLYFIAHDPYDHDSSSGPSLGVAYVIKRANNISRPDDMIVASYIGRPATQDEYNMNLFMLAEFYNCRIGFENDRGDVIGYAKRFKKLHLLEEEFELSYNSNLPKSGVRRGYGMHMSEPRKRQGEIYLRDWLIQKRTVDNNGNIFLNLHNIYDIALLDELRTYNPHKGNFDRVSAMLVAMYYMKEIDFKEIQVTINTVNQMDSLFERQLF